MQTRVDNLHINLTTLLEKKKSLNIFDEVRIWPLLIDLMHLPEPKKNLSTALMLVRY
jgi:hypothetical protein